MIILLLSSSFFKVFIELVTILLPFYVLIFWPWSMWDLSSLIRDWTCISCVERQSLNHWIITREVCSSCLKLYYERFLQNSLFKINNMWHYHVKFYLFWWTVGANKSVMIFSTIFAKLSERHYSRVISKFFSLFNSSKYINANYFFINSNKSLCLEIMIISSFIIHLLRQIRKNKACPSL